MATRRPRIKAVANIQLNTKRKPKSAADATKNAKPESKICEGSVSKVDTEVETSNGEENVEMLVESDTGFKTSSEAEENHICEELSEVAEKELNEDKTLGPANAVTKAKKNEESYKILKKNIVGNDDDGERTDAKGNLTGKRKYEELNYLANKKLSEEKELSVTNTEVKYEKNSYETVPKEGATNDISLRLQSTKKDEIQECLISDKNSLHIESTNKFFTTNTDETKIRQGCVFKDDKDAFKCPAKVDYSRSVSHSSAGGVDDVFYSDLEENALQMDLQRSANGFPMSPSKIQSRQRIRPTPIFGQRRNSFVGSSPSSHNSGQDEPLTCTDLISPQRKERHHSASLSNIANSSSVHQNLHYSKSAGSVRVRTESGCSNFSENNFPAHKLRRNDDLGHRHHLRREFEARFVNGVPDKSALKMFDLIYYNPATNPMEQKPKANIKLETNGNDIKPFEAKQEKSNVDDQADATASMPVPQLKLNANGELILDDESLVVETTAERKARKVWENSELVYLDENTGMNGFYKRQKRTREWEWSETIKFYRCLQTVGTDFSLMVSLFPNRTRRDLKLKFKKEERINGALINKALLHPKEFNIEELKQQVEAEEQERKKLQKMSRDYIEKKIKEPKKKKFSQHSAANRLLSGYDVYENEDQKIKRRRRRIKPNSGDKDVIEQSDTCVMLSEDCKRKVDAKINGEKRRRKRPVNIKNDTNNVKTQEIIKNEQLSKYESKQESFDLSYSTQEEDVKQLETELNNLLQSEMCELSNATDAVTSIPCMSSAQTSLTNSPEEFQTTHQTNVGDCHEFSLTNMDDGSITHVTDLTNDDDKRTPPSGEIRNIDNDLAQQHVQQILTELAEGSLVLVSTLDQDNPDKVLNEIYMMDKNSGDLCDEPLNIPDDIVQCIMSVMS